MDNSPLSTTLTPALPLKLVWLGTIRLRFFPFRVSFFVNRAGRNIPPQQHTKWCGFRDPPVPVIRFGSPLFPFPSTSSNHPSPGALNRSVDLYLAERWIAQLSPLGVGFSRLAGRQTGSLFSPLLSPFHPAFLIPFFCLIVDQ